MLTWDLQLYTWDSLTNKKLFPISQLDGGGIAGIRNLNY